MPRIGEVPFAKKSVKELAAQGSYGDSDSRGLLGSLVGSNRAPPLTPDAFAAVLSKKEFTNGADSATVINLYRDTATALLGSTRELRYEKLEWKEAQFERLGEALCYCGALETLEVKEMKGLSDTAAAAVVAGLASCTSLRTLYLHGCYSLTALPELPALTSLQTLDLSNCSSLTALLGLSALTSLQALNLWGCSSLTALPDLSALTDLKEVSLPDRLTPWEAGGFKAWDFITDGWPLDSTEIDLRGYGGATLPEWLSRCTSVRIVDLSYCYYLTALPDLSALTSLKTLNLKDCYSLTALPDLSALTSLQTLYLHGCYSLTALPDLSALTSLRTLNLDYCYSLTALPNRSVRERLKELTPPKHLKGFPRLLTVYGFGGLARRWAYG